MALRGARVGSFEWDFESGRVRISPEMETLHSFAPGGFGGTFDALRELVHPDDRERMAEGFRRAAHTGDRLDIQFRTLTGGRLQWRSVTANVIQDGAGRPVRMVGVGRNVGERHAAEVALNDAQARYRCLVEQLPLVTYVERLDADRAMFMSPQIAGLIGYTAEEWVADADFFGNVLHPDDREWVLAAFTAMHRGGTPFDGEYRLIARDGRTVWIQDAAALVSGDADAPSHIQGYMIDITARREAEQALGASRDLQRRQMEEIKHQALHDSLTGLPNRALFHDRIEQALERGQPHRDGLCRSDDRPRPVQGDQRHARPP